MGSSNLDEAPLLTATCRSRFQSTLLADKRQSPDSLLTPPAPAPPINHTIPPATHPTPPLAMTSSSSSSSAFALDSFSYGKSLVRLLRVVREASNPKKQDVIEYTVQSLLTGPTLDTSYTEGDNTLVVPTDTQKNTIHYFAKTLDGPSVLCPERFALELGNHFVKRYDHVTKCTIDVVAQKWSRIELDDGPHPHAFVRDGDEKRTVFVQTEKARVDGQDAVVCTQLKGGMKDLLVLKSSGSAFHSFWRDEFTTLKAVNDRIFSTSVECSCE